MKRILREMSGSWFDVVAPGDMEGAAGKREGANAMVTAHHEVISFRER